jgi:hypothetical protein
MHYITKLDTRKYYEFHNRRRCCCQCYTNSLMVMMHAMTLVNTA